MNKNKKIDEKEVEKEVESKKPDYTNDGVAVWVNVSKKGKKYLSIKIVGHKTVYAFKNPENSQK